MKLYYIGIGLNILGFSSSSVGIGMGNRVLVEAWEEVK